MIRSRLLTKLLPLTLVTFAIFLAATSGAPAQDSTQNADVDTLLLKAVEARDQASVVVLLGRGAHIEAKGELGTTPLMLATELGDAAMVKLLLARGADVHAQDEELHTALIKAAQPSPKPEITKLLLSKKPTTAEMDAALSAAAMGGPLVLNLPGIGEKYDDSEETRDKESAPYAEVARILLDAGANIEAKDEAGNTALITAASYGNTAVIRLLLEKGANMNATDPDGVTALMAAACDCGVIDKPYTDGALKLLLDHGAPMEARAKDGGTALMAAATSGHGDLVEILLQYGAKIEAKDHDGNTALMLAAEGSAIPTMDSAKVLLEHSAAVNSKNKKGQTALMLAASGRGDDPAAMVELLLRWGADPALRDLKGNTALDTANKSERPEAARILKDARHKY